MVLFLAISLQQAVIITILQGMPVVTYLVQEAMGASATSRSKAIHDMAVPESR